MDSIDLDYMRLAAIPELGSVGARKLLEHFGSPQAIFNADYESLSQIPRINKKTIASILANKDILGESYLQSLDREKVKYFSLENDIYPSELLETDARPLGLYLKGNPNVLKMPCIAIVGTRLCSLYGEKIARDFAAEFAKAGFCIISGLARGIDAAAHWGALDAGGSTIAVLGGGVDVIYPEENEKLYHKILENNAVISEYTLSRRVDKRTFPQRNRIIAGIAVATVVIESAQRGGSIITAGLASDYGRDVFAVPGRIDSMHSKGTNMLISQGVNIACSAQDVLEQIKFRYTPQNLEFDFSSPQAESPSSPPLPQRLPLSDDENYVLSFFQAGAILSLDEAILSITALPANKLVAIISMLEIKKYIVRTPNSKFEIF